MIRSACCAACLELRAPTIRSVGGEATAVMAADAVPPPSPPTPWIRPWPSLALSGLIGLAESLVASLAPGLPWTPGPGADSDSREMSGNAFGK